MACILNVGGVDRRSGGRGGFLLPALLAVGDQHYGCHTAVQLRDHSNSTTSAAASMIFQSGLLVRQ